MRLFARFVTQRPLIVLLAVLVLSVVALHGVVDLRTGELRLTVDPALERLMPDGDESRQFYERARTLFGRDEAVILVIEAEDVFAPDTLDQLQRLTKRLEQDPQVSQVRSLANVVQMESREGELFVGPFYDAIPRDPAALARLREQVLSHPIYGGTLVSRDAKTTALLIATDRVSDRDFVRTDVSGRLAKLARETLPGANVIVTGTPHVKAMLSRTIVDELVFILPAVMAISAALCAFAFRSIRGTVLPLVAIGIALEWTLGGMGWRGVPINLVSNIIPPLLITLGFAGAMHFISEYYEALAHTHARTREENRKAVQQVLEEMGLAIFVNGVTTVLGFLSLCVTTIVAIQVFGVWSAVGTVASTLISLTFLPAMCVLLGAPRKLLREHREGWVDRFAEWLAHFDVRNRNAIFAASLALLALSVYGASKIQVSSGFVTAFRSAAPVRADFERINQRLGGASVFSLVVESDEDGAMVEPENLKELRELQDWLEQQPEIGGTASLADGVMLLHKAFRGNDPAAHSIPDRLPLIRQLLLFGGDDVTQGFVDTTYRVARIQVRTTVFQSADVAALLSRINDRLAQLPSRLRARATGDMVLLANTMDAIVRSDLQSIGVAIATIYVTLSLLLTSFRVGLFALLPNLLPIMLYYGTLGLTGTPLDLSTSLIGAITLGIAVDDTVHYFARFALEARRAGGEARATATTLRMVIRPVTFTTLGLCLGFLSLTQSQLRTQVQFGVLSAFTLAVAWLLELTLSPAMCSRIRLVTLWDTLRLDLGPEPQRQIPLFAGLSARQARIFALLARIVEAPEGQRLFTEGEKGGEMFVVLSGTLASSIERKGERVALVPAQRGDVIGEVALFHGARTADVDVVEPARLLRFGNEDLERLGRRYPRIAARVYRNLNHVLAGRVVSTSAALR
jgi:predicted RND superfamily exporter protein